MCVRGNAAAWYPAERGMTQFEAKIIDHPSLSEK